MCFSVPRSVTIDAQRHALSRQAHTYPPYGAGAGDDSDAAWIKIVPFCSTVCLSVGAMLPLLATVNIGLAEIFLLALLFADWFRVITHTPNFPSSHRSISADIAESQPVRSLVLRLRTTSSHT